jgi:nitrite reductase/ring-hydroxylating ferredoxin subunit
MAYYRLEKLINLHEGYRQVFRVDGIALLLMVENGRRYLLRNMCPHKGFPLHNGTMSGSRLRCAFHAIEFDLEQEGRCVQHPMQPGVKLYPLVYEGNEVGVEL